MTSRPTDSVGARVIEPRKLSAPEVLLELGDRWTRQRLDALLDRLSAIGSMTDRMALACRELMGSPFLAESKLPLPPKGHVRFRIASLDCCTAIYNLIALVHSRTVTDLGRVLAAMRFTDGQLDNHPATGTFIGFTSETLFKRAIPAGLIHDATADVGRGVKLEVLRLKLLAHRRPRFLDEDETITLPRYADGVDTMSYIDVDNFEHVDWSRLRTGDIIIFTRGARLKDGSENFDLINHLGIATPLKNGFGLLHASRHFTVPPLQNGTAIFYDDAKTREQIGFGIAGRYLGDEYAIHLDADCLYGYDCSQPRSLLDYAASNFAGIAILRCSPADIAAA